MLFQRPAEKLEFSSVTVTEAHDLDTIVETSKTYALSNSDDTV